MRRIDREVRDLNEIEDILKQCRICSVAMIDENHKPYVVPLNFGYLRQDNQFTFYFHSAGQGKKIDSLRQAPEVCLTFVGEHFVAGEEDKACTYTEHFGSVMVEGVVEFIEDEPSKLQALKALMLHQTKRTDFVFDPRSVAHVCIFSVTATTLTGKLSAPKQH